MGSLRRWSALRVQLLFLPILVLGCGGSGGGTARGKNPAGAPKATITFPPAGALTDASQVTVTGTATDVDGVQSVSVNGAPCTSSDGFATWQAQVPVVVGANTMTVQTVDGIGNTQPNAASVSIIGTTAMAFDPTGVAVDAANNRALVSFLIPPTVLAVDLSSGDRSVISRAGTGSGTNLVAPTGLEHDAANGRVLVIDLVLGNGLLLSVDLATGDRTVISDASTGSGGPITFPFAVSLDAARNQALVCEVIGSPPGVVAVDLANGDVTTLSANGNPLGPPDFGLAIGLDIDPANDQLLVVDNLEDILFGVDLGTGGRTVISGGGTGTGTSFGAPRSVCLDTTTNPVRALVGDTVVSGLVAVNLQNGARTVVSDPFIGSGTALGEPEDVEVDAAGNRALVVSAGADDLVLAVDLATGDRTAFTQMPGVGSGTALDAPLSLALDSSNGRVLVVDNGLDAVVAVAISGGDRTIVSGAGTGSGTGFSFPTGIVLDEANARVLVSDSGLDAIVAVDLGTGDRTTISNDSTGSGTAFDTPTGLALDATNGRVLVTDSVLDAVVSVDLGTGNRTIIADDSTGTGTNLDVPNELILDLASNRVLVVDQGLDAVLAVDLISGNRTIISAAGTGTGGAFGAPADLALDLAGNRLLVVDSETNQVIAVDLSTGDRTEVSGSLAGTGPLTSSLLGVVRDAANQTLFVVDSNIDAVLAVEAGSGDRVMISR